MLKNIGHSIRSATISTLTFPLGTAILCAGEESIGVAHDLGRSIAAHSRSVASHVSEKHEGKKQRYRTNSAARGLKQAASKSARKDQARQRHIEKALRDAADAFSVLNAFGVCVKPDGGASA